MQKAGLRIVFRESEKGLEIIQVIAIGKRENQDVFHAAADRIK
jgi:mRNA interferase RelE/StbE